MHYCRVNLYPINHAASSRSSLIPDAGQDVASGAFMAVPDQIIYVLTDAPIEVSYGILGRAV